MARIESRIKLGYYATPESVADLLCRFLKPQAVAKSEPTSGQTRNKSLRHAASASALHLLDPCAGTGAALARLAAWLQSQSTLPVISHAIELESNRAELCKQIVDDTLNCSCFDVACTKESMSLQLLNPPYDWDYRTADHKSQRLEKTFYQTNFEYVARGGLLIFIVPINVALDVNLAKSLTYRFGGLRVLKFPATEYERFSQVIIFGVRKTSDAFEEHATHRFLAEVAQACSLDEAVGTFQYEIPAVKGPVIFRDFHPCVAEMKRELCHSTLIAELDRVVLPPRRIAGLNPMMPLSIGHLATMLTAGVINGQLTKGEETIVVKGFAQQVSSTRIEKDPDSGEDREVETRHTAVTVRYFDKHGALFVVK